MKLTSPFTKIAASIGVILLAAVGICRAEGAERREGLKDPPLQGLAANTIVKIDTLAVHSEARGDSDVVQSLKKGDALIVGLELKIAGEKWCSVGFPGQGKLGFVDCDGLERTDKRAGDLALPAEAPPSSEGVSVLGGAVVAGAIPLPRMHSSNEGSGEWTKVQAAVVHDGTLDGAKVAEFEAAAAGGGAAAMERAVLAHEAAAVFELQHRDSEQALEQLRAALPFAAKSPLYLFSALIEIAYIHLIRSEYSAALDVLAQARRVKEGTAAVAQLSGWAYSGMNRLDDAIREWETAQRIAPNAQIGALLESARRDKGIEAGARASESSHFVLHYQGSATPQLANEILRTLEEHYRELQNDLHFTPPEAIGVILYTQQSFRDVTHAADWMGALNDGRIRAPVQGLDSVTESLSRMLMHELTHSFVRQMTVGRCPTWLQEGLAQWMEGRRSAGTAASLVAAYDRGVMVSLKQLEGSWTGFSGPVAAVAYAWALAAVESVMVRSGQLTINRLLGDLSSAGSSEEALREALQMGYADLDRGTADYLRESYLH